MVSMEALWQNLQEQQIKLQKQQEDLHAYDLANMESINRGEPPLPPPRKYVSIFHIDGEPILPPLMTTEKRRQMQKYKEIALKIEKSLQDRKHHTHSVDNDDGKSETSRSSHCNTGGNVSQRSQGSYERNFKEYEESMNILENIIKRQQAGVPQVPVQTVNIASSTTNLVTDDENLEKMQKLKKSEILIYDNSTNEVIQVPAEQSKNPENEENNYNLPPKKPSHLLLAGVNGEGLTTIPTICLNPPTPLTTVNRPITDDYGKSENNQSLIINENSEICLHMATEHSSEESFNSMRTHSDKRLTRNVRQHTVDTLKMNEEKFVIPSKNVSAKIQKFEAKSSDSSTPYSSPEKMYKPRNTCLGGHTNRSGIMNRSATSPSIKLSASNRSSSSRSQSLAQDSDNSPENSLVRSSSFTLEGPSKALIDHMRQQKTISENKSTPKSSLNATRIINKKPISTPLRVYRDTVESKAKKVQKVELKSSKQKFHQKTSQCKLSQAVTVSSISPYTTHAPITTQNINNNSCKTKRSPYDIFKTSHPSMLTIQKTPNTQMRKSSSTSSNLSQRRNTSKLKNSTPSTIQQTPTSSVAKNLSGSSILPYEMDKIQKEKFQRLLAQQEDEQRKLQKSFEMQQKLLLQQLNQEYIGTEVKSSTNALNSSTPKKQRDQLNLLGLTCITKPEKQTPSSVESKQQKTLHKQRSSPTLSNSKNSSNKANGQHPLSYAAINNPQSPQNYSHLSSIDYSNANTSLDISSMLSTQTSPATTPNTQQISANNISGKSNSSSRRRLFATETNVIDSSRSTASSSYTLRQRATSGEQMQQHQQLHQNNTNSSLVSTNGGSSSRRLQY